jgi:SAM-dependent methyltransferase
MNLGPFLKEPTVAGVDVDGVERLHVHRTILDRKPLIREVFTEIHDLMLDLEQRLLSGHGTRIEIGAGVYPIRESDADVLATDVVAGPNLDRVLDAQCMDVPDSSVRTIFGQHCFHHLPEPSRFLTEARRVLVPGGGVILVEPYWGPVASLIFKRLFTSETFDKNVPNWETPLQGSMSGANQALSYVVFERDIERYTENYPDLPIIHREILHNHFRYIVSGGLNFRQLLPNAAIPFLKGLELITRPLNRWIGLHHAIVLRKRI